VNFEWEYRISPQSVIILVCWKDLWVLIIWRWKLGEYTFLGLYKIGMSKDKGKIIKIAGEREASKLTSENRICWKNLTIDVWWINWGSVIKEAKALRRPKSQEATNKQTSWPESASELYRPRDRHLLAKLVPTFLRIAGATWSAWRIPMAVFSAV
jgi:hypothetical protein